MAAPATVSSELTPTLCHWLRTRRAGKAWRPTATCEPGDLPSPEEPYVPGGVHREEGQPERWPYRRRLSLSASSMHPLHRRGGNSFNAYHGRLSAAHPRSGLDGRRGAVRGGGRAPDRAHYRGSSRNQASARNIRGLRLRAVGAEDSVRYGELFAPYRGGVGCCAVRAECDGGAGKYRAAVPGASAGPWRDHHAGR